MKKLFIVLTALMAVAVFATSSFALGQVQMTLTSPTIYKAGCEKVGSTTYSFDAGTIISAGDWWYMDLPENVTLCKDYDFVIAGLGAADADLMIHNVADPYQNVGFNSAGIPNGAVTLGPLTAAATGAGAATITTTGSMAFLVKGTSGSRRVTIYALTATGTAGAENITVNADTALLVKIFDGKSWSKTDAAAPTETRILVKNSEGVYGGLGLSTNLHKADGVIGGDNRVDATAGVPYAENTLCVNATQMSGQYLYTSYASRNDKFTFSGDSQIAHTAAAATIALATCKGAASDNITITGGQTSTCAFDYDSGTEIDYCTSGFKNKVLIHASSGAFGDIDDKYFVTAQITSPSDGVYFGGYPMVQAYKSSEDECADYVPTVGTTVVAASSANWTMYEGATALTTWKADNDCAVGTGSMVTKIEQKASYADLDDYDTIWVNFDDFVYTNAAVAAGEEVIVRVTLNRYPCGQIFTGDVTIGSFVTSCATSATSVTLYFPWLPGTSATGWWGGYVITNVGTTAGTAALTYNDSAGGTATYTTPSVAAGAQWVNTAVTAAMLTDVDGFDMSLNHSVTAVCAFSARGFAFTGNGTEGTGYLANGLDGTNKW